MKNLLIIVVVSILLSGCLSQRHGRIIVKEITRVDSVVVVKDSTIYAQLPADTVNITDTIVVKEGIATIEPKRVDTKFCFAIGEVRNNVFYLNVYQKEDSIPVRIEYREIKISEFKQVPYPVPAEFNWWQKLYLTLGKFTFFLIILSVGYFLISLKFPFLKLWR